MVHGASYYVLYTYHPMASIPPASCPSIFSWFLNKFFRLLKLALLVPPQMEASYFDVFEDESCLKMPGELAREKPRTDTRDQFFEAGTRHETVIPFGTEYATMNREPECTAKQYKFELDFFQKLSICAIERDESVMVSAHTSCGKTVVAEYAIAQSIRNNQRVVYTSPIKALSNQKYRELQEEFGDVGLMTGDVTINPTASCLVMTTEIFRNMLYRGSEIIREVHWVIFDEIHYMKDKERGVVWEETIILLPPHVRMVFLSATIPNALEFAEWVCYISMQPVHVVYTEKRVIPLLHYFYTDDLYLIKEHNFDLKNFTRALAGPVKKADLGKAVGRLLDQINVPAVIFSFSRKDCEQYAVGVKKDFNSPEEKEMVRTIFDNAVASLREEDRKIPIIEKMLPLLQRGVGIHHSGLLPIIKEIVEILFQESLLKVLFATETFSIGLNMPAKTVVFTSLNKFDGVSRRLLTSGEYIQMSGRAGRRGLDDQGIAVSIITEAMAPAQAKSIFSESADKLYSAFRLTYNMILNLMRVEGLDSLFILSRSFFHFQAYKNALVEEERVFSCIEEYKNLSAEVPEESKKLYELLQNREELLRKRGQGIAGTYADHIGMRGRVVDILVPRIGESLFVHNAIIKSVSSDRAKVSAFVLTNKDIECMEFPMDSISAVYNIRCKIDLKVFGKRFKPLEYSDPLDDEIGAMEEAIHRIAPSIDLQNCLLCRKPARSCLVKCKYSKTADPIIDGATDMIMRDKREQELKDKMASLSTLREIYHMEECKKMMNVLRVLGYADETSVLIKGKMASEISTGDELVITEMIFGSRFTELPLVDMVALITCTICEEKPSDAFTLSEENGRTFEILKESVQKVCTAMNRCGISVTPETYLNQFSYQMMDIVKMWMSGFTFIEICESTSIFEGSIIRTFKRLEELLRQLVNAAMVIGNNDLVELFGQGIYLIKRDIVFTNSLYL